MTGVRLRLALAADLDEVLAFWRDHAEGTDRRDDREVLDRLLAHDPEALVLADLDGRLVGTLIAGWDGWRCHLYRLAVHAEYRGQAIARLLVASAEARFAAAGGRRSDAMVLEDNAEGRRAWSALGYAPQPQWQRWVKRLR